MCATGVPGESYLNKQSFLNKIVGGKNMDEKELDEFIKDQARVNAMVKQKQFEEFGHWL